VSIEHHNNETIGNAFWRGGKSMHADGTLEHVCAKRRGKVSQLKGKYATRLSTLIQAI